MAQKVAEVFPQDERKQEEREKDIVSLVFLSSKLDAASSKGKLASVSRVAVGIHVITSSSHWH